MIVVDDGSNDGTQQVLREFIADPRVLLITFRQNKGAAAARNEAIERARGEWLAFLDADDEWHPFYLERVVEVGRRYPNSMVACDSWVCASLADGKMLPLYRLFPRSGLPGRWVERILPASQFVTFAVGIHPLVPAWVVRRGARFREGISFGEDLWFYLQAFRLGCGLVLLNEPLYRYRLRPGAASRVAPDAWVRDLFSVIDAALELGGWDDDLESALARRRLAAFRWSQYDTFARAVKAGRWSEALRFARKHPWVVLWLMRRFPVALRDRAYLVLQRSV